MVTATRGKAVPTVVVRDRKDGPVAPFKKGRKKCPYHPMQQEQRVEGLYFTSGAAQWRSLPALDFLVTLLEARLGLFQHLRHALIGGAPVRSAGTTATSTRRGSSLRCGRRASHHRHNRPQTSRAGRGPRCGSVRESCGGGASGVHPATGLRTGAGGLLAWRCGKGCSRAGPLSLVLAQLGSLRNRLRGLELSLDGFRRVSHFPDGCLKLF